MMRKLTLLCIASAIAATPLSLQAQDQLSEGKVLFEHWGASCHGAGPGHPGTQALELRYQGSKPGPLEERDDLTPPFVGVFVRNGISVMPFFRKTEINDEELAAIGAYLSQSDSIVTE